MSRPVEITVQADIVATPSAIWERLVDWEGMGSWMLEGSGFKRTSEQKEGVGVRAEAMISIGGLKTLDPIEVTGWQPGERLEIRHLGWVKGKGVIELEAIGDITRVVWRETLHPPMGIFGAVGMRLFKPLMQMTFRRDLLQLKTLLELPRER